MTTVNFARNPVQLFLGLVLILCLWHSLNGRHTKTSDIICSDFNYACLDSASEKLGVICVRRQWYLSGCEEHGGRSLVLIKCKYYYPASVKVKMTETMCKADR